MGLSHKYLHFFLNKWQERTSGLYHCTVLIYDKLGLDKKTSRHVRINNELLLPLPSEIPLVARTQSEIIFTCCEIKIGTASLINK